jgi:hypothetical protein
MTTDPMTRCQVFSQGLLEMIVPDPVMCSPNTTCDVTLANGFIIIAGRYDNRLVTEHNFTAEVQLVRGPDDLVRECEFGRIGTLSIDGFAPGEELGNLTTVCEAPKVSVAIGVRMVVLLFGVLAMSVVMYHICKPKRDQHETERPEREGRRGRKKRADSLEERALMADAGGFSEGSRRPANMSFFY